MDFFGSGILMMGFVIDDELGNGYVIVFVFIGLNFINGFVFYMKEEDVKYVNICFEDVMWFIISVGVGFFSFFDLLEVGKVVEGDIEKELFLFYN